MALLMWGSAAASRYIPCIAGIPRRPHLLLSAERIKGIQPDMPRRTAFPVTGAVLRACCSERSQNGGRTVWQLNRRSQTGK
jgi:hypothetical protein